MNDIARNLRLIMAYHNLTQTELATRTGLDKGHVSLILSSKLKPTVKTLRKLAQGLGVPLSTVIELPFTLPHPHHPRRAVPFDAELTTQSRQ